MKSIRLRNIPIKANSFYESKDKAFGTNILIISIILLINSISKNSFFKPQQTCFSKKFEIIFEHSPKKSNIVLQMPMINITIKIMAKTAVILKNLLSIFRQMTIHRPHIFSIKQKTLDKILTYLKRNNCDIINY